MKMLRNFYRDKIILVTGAAGSIGSEIVKKLLDYDLKLIRVLDNNETGLFELKQKLCSDNIELFFADVRDKERVRRAVRSINIVFHAAALKHVPLCECSPFEAVKTNILGTQNLIESAIDEKVDKFITISTNKTVNPANVLGATKLISERLTLSASFYGKTAFSCIRFGNVLNSKGSVVPLFEAQIKSGEPVSVTHPEMTRFIISISHVVELILKSTEMAQGGEVFICESPALCIGDLAEAIIEEIAPKYGYKPHQIKIKIIGKRPGEKIHEELLTEDEAVNAYEIDGIVVILPQILDNLTTKELGAPKDKLSKCNFKKYLSRDTKLLTRKDIKKLLKQERIS